ncbi:MAG: hypothetical protein KTR16_05955 [Acidiferrobacterales bacterium]|nr:hypothetical protein [Acidiferrobacterales bacterium]
MRVVYKDDSVAALATSLAILHEFNGWADQFHYDTSDEDDMGVDSFGNEINLVHVRPIIF